MFHLHLLLYQLSIHVNMSVININTATMEELMKIKDIGETRSKLIIKARTAKGSLTLEDLQRIESVPNTM